MGSSLMSLPLVNDRRLGIGVKHHRMRYSEQEPSQSSPTSLQIELHVASYCADSCWFAFAFFPTWFLVGRSALSVLMQCTCNDIPHPPEAAQTADQYRVLSMLPMKPPTSRIQENNNGNVLHEILPPSIVRSETCGWVHCASHLFDE